MDADDIGLAACVSRRYRIFSRPANRPSLLFTPNIQRVDDEFTAHAQYQRVGVQV